MSWFQKLIYGVDLDEEQKRGEELDAKLAASNADLRDRGVWTEKQYDQAMDHLAAGATGDVGEQVTEEFKAGAIQGLQDELKYASQTADFASSTVKGTLNFAAGTIFGAIPWWLWLVGLGYGFFWLGGLTWLKRKAFK